MPLPDTFINAGLIVWALVTAVWLISLLLRDSSIMDPFWGIGFVILAWAYFVHTPLGAGPRKGLLVTLILIWGLRLSIYLLHRNRQKGEDSRYARWREEAGAAWWWRSYFKVFLLQGALMWFLSLPLLAVQAAAAPENLIWLDYLALLFWIVGFAFEVVGDWQLARFKSDPDNKNKVLVSGLWRYTRHPNYFGEAAMWWSYGLLAAAAGAWWALFSPALMTWLLLRVSGVAMLEKDLENSKPGYKEYIRRTSAFVPLPPQSN